MLKSAWYSPYNPEAQSLPQGNCAGVCTYHQIELHAAVSQHFGNLERMPAEVPSYSFAALIRMHHIPAIGYMCTQTWLVRLDKIRSGYLTVNLGHKGLH